MILCIIYMRKNSRNILINNVATNSKLLNIDNMDLKIIDLLVAGHKNKQIASKVKIPLSTVQRRTRKLLEKGLVKEKVEPNHEKLGFKRGLFHVYLSNGNIHSIAEALAKVKGIASVSIHLGNSDIVCLYIYKDSKEILDLIAQTKHFQGVERVLWSEEVETIPIAHKEIGISDTLTV
jgi:Lrp/AsnC family transcriptional regulator for asnA, asnC and gidA